MGIGRGNHPNSKAALTSSRFKTVPGAASQAGVRSGEVKRSRKEDEAIVDQFLSELLDMAFAQSSLDEFREKAKSAPSQALRVVALNLANPKTAMNTLQWIVERIKGKPRQEVAASVDANLAGETGLVIGFKKPEPEND